MARKAKSIEEKDDNVFDGIVDYGDFEDDINEIPPWIELTTVEDNLVQVRVCEIEAIEDRKTSREIYLTSGKVLSVQNTYEELVKIVW